MTKLKIFSAQKLTNDSKKRWQSVIAVFLSIFVIVAINSVIIFREGWIFVGLPDCYLYTALQKYYGKITGVPPKSDYELAWNWNVNDNILSPLYAVSSLLGHIGSPTPQWFRMTGVVLLILIFFVSYFLLPAPQLPIDRLVVAVTVATTPVVLFATRYLEDFGLHMLVLLLGAMILLHSRMGRIASKAFIFYLLPSFALFSTLTITNFLIAMMSFAAIYFYSLIVRLKETGLVAVAKSEIPRLMVAALVFLLVSKIRTPDGLISFSYYRSEATNPQIDFEGIKPVSWFIHLLAYPGILLFSTNGVVLCAIAALNLKRKFRISHAWLHLLWILIPLIILTPLSKKNPYYVWTLAPAISILAAGVILKLSLMWKRLWILVCFIFATLQLVCLASPLEEIMNIKGLFQGDYLINQHCRERYDAKRDLRIAKEILELADKCGPIENRPLQVLEPFFVNRSSLYFCLLYLDQRPTYWFLKESDLRSDGATVIEVRDSREYPTAELWKFWLARLKECHEKLEKTHSIVYESPKYIVYCPK